MERDIERRADVRGRKWILECDRPRHVRWFSKAAARKETPEPADDVAERDAGREDIAGRPERQSHTADVPERHRDGDDQPSVEHAAFAQKVEQFRRVALERLE